MFLFKTMKIVFKYKKHLKNNEKSYLKQKNLYSKQRAIFYFNNRGY